MQQIQRTSGGLNNQTKPNQTNIFKGTIDIIYSEPSFVKLHANIIQNPLNFYRSNKEEDLSALSYIC